MKGMDIKLSKLAFQYLLQAAGQVGGATDSEGGVASDNIQRLLDHIKVRESLSHFVWFYWVTFSTRGHPYC